MSDVIMQRAARTFPVPKAVQQEATWSRAKDPVTEWYRGMVLSGSPLTSDVISLVASIIKWDALQKWADRVQNGVAKDQHRSLIASLENVGYDPSTWTYLGIADRWDKTVIRSLVRVGADPTAWEAWTKGGWRAVPEDRVRKADAYDLDGEMVGFVASVINRCDGVLVKLDAPVARLPHEPAIVAAVTESLNEGGVHYYAVVDSTDATAVMNLIAITPGPNVRVREGGRWNPQDDMVASLKGPPPMPLVELDRASLEMVMAQIDGKIAEAQGDPEQVESLGHEDEIEFQQNYDAAEQVAGASDEGAEVHPSPQSLDEENPENPVDEPVDADEEYLTPQEQEQPVDDEEMVAALAAIDKDIAEQRSKDAEALERFDTAMDQLRGSDYAGDPELMNAIMSSAAITEAMDVELRRRKRNQEALEALLRSRENMVKDIRRQRQVDAITAAGRARTKLAALETVRGATRVTTVSTDSLKRYWTPDAGGVFLAWCHR